MSHGAPDYSKQIVIPDVGVSFQNLSVYPGKFSDFIAEEVIFLTGTVTVYTVPEGYTLYITNMNFMVANSNPAKNVVGVLLQTDSADNETGRFAEAYLHEELIAVYPMTFSTPYKIEAGNKIAISLNDDDGTAAVHIMGYLE